jgi:hypothetical protein
VSASLEAIVDHCLAARRVARDNDEEFVAQLLDAVLFAAGCRLAGVAADALAVKAAVEREDSKSGLVIAFGNGKGRNEAH